jgi:hypothetical protein
MGHPAFRISGGVALRHTVLELIIVLLIAILAVLVWINHGIYKVTVNQVAILTLIDSIRGELETVQDRARRRVPHP